MNINFLISNNNILKNDYINMDSNYFWYKTNNIEKKIMESDLVGLHKERLLDNSLSESTVLSNIHIYEKWRDYLHKKTMLENNYCSIKETNYKCLKCPHRNMHVSDALKVYNITPDIFFNNRYKLPINITSKVPNEKFKQWFKEFINYYKNNPKSNGEMRSPNTIATYIKQIKRWQTVMNQNPGVNLDFADSVKVKEITNILEPISPLELQHLSTEILNNSSFYANNVLSQKRLKSIFFLMLQTGLRLNEVCLLNKDNLNMLNDGTGELKILGKGAKERIVGVSQETIILIRDYLAERNSKIIDNNPALFLNSNFERINRWSIIEMLKRISKKTGVKINAHKIRRTSATLRVQDGADQQDLKNNFGWSSDKVANRYMASAKNVESINSQKKFNPFVTNQTILENQSDSSD